MADGIQIVTERGKKKAVAYAPSWPGWSRGASSIETAIERLATYADRYRGVADLAGLSGEFPSTPVFEIGEEVPEGHDRFLGDLVRRFHGRTGSDERRGV